MGLAFQRFAILGALGLCSLNARAEATRTIPLVEMGAQFYSGTDGASLTGNRGYFLIFRAEGQRGRFRPYVASQFDYSSGTTTISGSSLKYTLFGGTFEPGYNIFLFKEGYLQPFFGVNGALGWNLLHLTAAPATLDAYTQGFGYGYEVSVGVDLRTKRADGSAIRLRCGLWNYRAMIGGSSSYGLNGYRFVAGWVF